MSSNVQTHVLLPSTVPTLVVIAIAVAALAAWVAMHVWLRRPELPSARAASFVALAALGSFSVWLYFNVLARFFTLETPWRLWACALASGIVAEAIIVLYEREGRTLRPATRGIVGAMRLALLLLIATMLVEPVLVHQIPHEEERFVAVLVDVSASMDISDGHASASEKLALAEALLPAPEGGQHPFRAERWFDEASSARDRIAPHVRWLGLARDGAATAAQLQQRGETMADGLGQAAQALEALAGEMTAFTGGGKLPENEAAALKAQANELVENVAAPVQKAADSSSDLDASEPAQAASAVLELLEPAETALASTIKALPLLCAAADEATLASLQQPRRDAIEQLASKTRRAVAHACWPAGRMCRASYRFSTRSTRSESTSSAPR